LNENGTKITVKNSSEKTIVGYSDPSFGSLTMLRTEFSTGSGKNVAGRILTESYRGAFATDFFTAKNSNEVVIQPSTTYRGYQYI
jgi:hypothetical protein